MEKIVILKLATKEGVYGLTVRKGDEAKIRQGIRAVIVKEVREGPKRKDSGWDVPSGVQG